MHAAIGLLSLWHASAQTEKPPDCEDVVYAKHPRAGGDWMYPSVEFACVPPCRSGEVRLADGRCLDWLSLCPTVAISPVSATTTTTTTNKPSSSLPECLGATQVSLSSGECVECQQSCLAVLATHLQAQQPPAQPPPTSIAPPVVLPPHTAPPPLIAPIYRPTAFLAMPAAGSDEGDIVVLSYHAHPECKSPGAIMGTWTLSIDGRAPWRVVSTLPARLVLPLPTDEEHLWPGDSLPGARHLGKDEEEQDTVYKRDMLISGRVVDECGISLVTTLTLQASVWVAPTSTREEQWPCPMGAPAVQIEAWGGGGAGQVGSTVNGWGGGAGAYGRGRWLCQTEDALRAPEDNTWTLTVGQAGIAPGEPGEATRIQPPRAPDQWTVEGGGHHARYSDEDELTVGQNAVGGGRAQPDVSWWPLSEQWDGEDGLAPDIEAGTAGVGGHTRVHATDDRDDGGSDDRDDNDDRGDGNDAGAELSKRESRRRDRQNRNKGKKDRRKGGGDLVSSEDKGGNGDDVLASATGTEQSLEADALLDDDAGTAGWGKGGAGEDVIAYEPPGQTEGIRVGQARPGAIRMSWWAPLP